MSQNAADPAPADIRDRAASTTTDNRSQFSRPALDAEVDEFLDDLTELAVPIAHAVVGDDEQEFHRPTGWQDSTVDGNAAARAAHAARGGALLGILGGKVAVVDVDTKNGGSVEDTRALLAQLGVTTYAEIATPSGGRHFHVAGHPDLPSVGASKDREGLTGHPGVEILAAGRNAFLPGTTRPTYDGRGYEIVSNNLAALADGGDEDSAERLVDWVLAHRATTARGEALPTVDTSTITEAPEGARERARVWLARVDFADDARRLATAEEDATIALGPVSGTWETGGVGGEGMLAYVAARALRLDATREALGLPPQHAEEYVAAFVDRFGANSAEARMARRKLDASREYAAERGPKLPPTWAEIVDEERAKEQLTSGGSGTVGGSGGSAGGEQSGQASGGSDGIGGSGGSDGGGTLHRGIELPADVIEDGEHLLDEVRAFLARHISVNDDHDLDILTTWAAHTHVAERLHTTPRLQIDSPVPESGKTTVLEHLQRLSFSAVLASSISSPALLARLVEHEPRTLLFDEVDRTLDPKKEGAGDLLAVLNSGYKAGATRPTLIPVKGGGWEAKELPTFAPVAMAGNQPALPDDTRSRIIRVVLLPDHLGVVEESDWEEKDAEASMLGARLARWALHVHDEVRPRPDMPQGCTSRLREKWQPLARVAQAAGPRWLATMLECAAEDVARVQQDREAGLAAERPSLLVLRHILQDWPTFSPFWKTTDMRDALVREHPEVWGESSDYGKALTVQRLGRMLVSSYNIRSTVEDSADKNSPRGYRRSQFERAARALNSRPTVAIPEVQAPPARTAGTSDSAGTAGTEIPLADSPCPGCGGRLEASREAAGLACLSCYGRGA
ncbi:hypothetical protein CWN80_00245 [Janibacter hoylei PVAS-1]|uniref:DNA primase/polymerase bifunctional N-terminal domain-containing protein n=1 Tax=Janibacter hoylei PVAS-1 TaxID=1210046 RepID=A0A444BAL5_9MICO|nr:DUF3631 domain-containing protein [Janibacter hoylei]RWU85464.1 hypothetical protein CWN80_00245 [Janibacter hoylei PVAS-1]